MTTKSKRTYAGAAALVIVIIAAAWLTKTKHASPEKAIPVNTTSNTPGSTPTKADQNQEGVWFGTLKTSDNVSKGNLMLATKDRNIYLKTSRDFSNLIGKQVYVTYEGDLNSFVLGDISENEPQ